MTKNNFYVITGGPGGGKTSLLETLASKGYDYIPETARQIIKMRLSKGVTARPDAKTFAREIFERDWKNFISNSDRSSFLFFDRSFMDSACMLFDSDFDTYDKIRNTHLQTGTITKYLLPHHGKKYIEMTQKEINHLNNQ